MAHRILNQTETKAVIKVWGTSGTTNDTVTLNSDLLSGTAIVSGTPTVNINFLTWCLSDGGSDLITITRNSVPIAYLTHNGFLDFSGNGGWTEDSMNTDNISVTIVGSGIVYITVHKVAGYASKIEPHAFSIYDNTDAVGS